MGPNELASLVDNALSLIALPLAIAAYRSKTGRFRGQAWVLVAGVVPCIVAVAFALPVLSRHFHRHKGALPSNLAASLAAAPIVQQPATYQLDGGYEVTLPASFRAVTPSGGPLLIIASNGISTVGLYAGDHGSSDIALAEAILKDTATRNQDFATLVSPVRQQSGWVLSEFSLVRNGISAKTRMLLRFTSKESIHFQVSAPESLFQEQLSTMAVIEASIKTPQ